MGLCSGYEVSQTDAQKGADEEYRVTTCLENLEMSGNLKHVREKISSWKSVQKLFITRTKTAHSYMCIHSDLNVLRNHYEVIVKMIV